MDRHAVYTLLAAELERWRSLPYETLIGHIGAGPTARTVEVSGEPIGVEVLVRWQNAATGAIRIEATGNGPSWWKMERLEEAATVPRVAPLIYSPLAPWNCRGRMAGRGFSDRDFSN